MLNEKGVPKIAILMCTYNGARYLTEQIDSLLQQVGCDWRLYVSDDGSTDETLSILKSYQDRLGTAKILIRQGPSRGYAINFLSLAADKSIRADYYAFCDQDDVWLPNKLEVAIDSLKQCAEARPALYCGRTRYTTNQLKPYGLSPCFAFPPCFRNALVQSIAGGNTMLFNQMSKVIVEKSGVRTIVSHDWWLYQLVSGCGGVVVYDPVPYILYRQHGDALIGENQKLLARAKRIVLLIRGRFKNWNSIHIQALTQCSQMLSSEAKLVLETFKTLRAGRLKDRVRLVEVAGLYRQTFAGTVSLYIAAIFNKV